MLAKEKVTELHKSEDRKEWVPSLYLPDHASGYAVSEGLKWDFKNKFIEEAHQWSVN